MAVAVFSYGQYNFMWANDLLVKNKFWMVRIASNDTMSFYQDASTSYWNSTNPIQINTDTLKLFGKNITKITPQDSITGNIANFNNFADTLFFSRLLSKRIGLNTLTTYSKLDMIGTNALGKDMLIMADNTINKNISSLAQRIDTSSGYWSFTPLGKPLYQLKNHAGKFVQFMDSLGSPYSWTNNCNTTRAYPYTSHYFYTNLAYKGITMMNEITDGAGSGGYLTLCQHDGTITGDGIVIGNISFGGAYGTGATSISTPVAIRSSIEGTPSGVNDIGGNIYIFTTPDGSGTPIERWRISGAGVQNLTLNTSSQDSLFTQKESSRILPNGTITLTASQSGFGTVFIDSSGVRLAKIEFSFQDDGTVYLDASYKQSYITVGTVGTEGVAIYDGGTSAIIKNNRAYSYTARLVVNYATN